MIRYQALERGIIYLDQDIDENCESIYVMEIERCEQMLTDTLDKMHPDLAFPLSVHITSPGGSVYHSFAIYDTLRSVAKRRPVYTHVKGYAASCAAAIILQAGDRRTSTKNSRFLLHEVSSMPSLFTVSEAKDNVNEMNKLNDMIIDLLASRCKKDREVVAATIERKEHWMSADEARDWGLIDDIV